MIAALAELTAAQAALVAALDEGRVERIEAATHAIAAALARVKALGPAERAEASRDAIAHALTLVDAAAVRTNFLADQSRRRLERVMRARGDAPRIGYARMAQGLA